MATFKVVVRKKRADGFYPVYIRVVHRSRIPPRTRRMTSWQVQSVRFVKCQTPCFPEAHRAFTRYNFVLKISGKANPSYLVIANNLKKEQIVGSLNTLVLNLKPQSTATNFFCIILKARGSNSSGISPRTTTKSSLYDISRYCIINQD